MRPGIRRIRGIALLLLASFARADTAPSKIEIRAGDRLFTNRPDVGDGKSLRVLFLGNSLTYWNEMPWMLEKVAAAGSPQIVAEFVGASGMSLRQQWERGHALRAIRERRWDFVVLQGQSSEPETRPDEFARYARRLDLEIRRRGARTVFFLTWANRGKSQDAITTRYRKAARDLGAFVAPVGIAWQALQAKGSDLYDESGVHSNLAGSYLSACVFYATLTGKTPVGLPHRFDVRFDIEEFYREGLEKERLSASDALAIQRAAWSAVSSEKP